MDKKITKKGKQPAIQAPKGMHDMLPENQLLWDKILKTYRDIAEFYNFKRLDTPILEREELFLRAVGEATDIVEKEMFVVKTRGKERLVLRPEATAPIARAYIENSLGQMGFPVKLYHEGPMFRYEKPQAGRMRQFYDLDFEILSNEIDAVYDTQIILVMCRFLEALKIKNLTVAINSIGCKGCRPNYRKQLQTYYKSHKKILCKDCLRRLEINPLRLLDCKKDNCKELKKDAPTIIDHLCKGCHQHFKEVLEYLEELKLPYSLDHYLVRGLDYYTKTVFEIRAEGLPFDIAGGGRYDYLIETLGGKSTPGVGCGIGVERIIEVIKQQEINLVVRKKPKISFIYIGELAKKRSLVIIEELRENHIDVTESLGKESLNAQLRVADKIKSPLALIFGQKEAFEDSIIIRNLETGAQETVPLKKASENIKKRLKK